MEAQSASATRASSRWAAFPESRARLGRCRADPGAGERHTHLEFSDLKRPLGTQGDSLPAWIRTVIAERKRGNRRVEAAIAAGRAESLKSGVTALGEISTAAPSAYASSPAALRMALFHEVMGFSTLRADSALRHALDRWNVSRDVRCDEPLPGISPHVALHRPSATAGGRRGRGASARFSDRDAPGRVARGA